MKFAYSYPYGLIEVRARIICDFKHKCQFLSLIFEKLIRIYVSKVSNGLVSNYFVTLIRRTFQGVILTGGRDILSHRWGVGWSDALQQTNFSSLLHMTLF